ncbi:MAG: hypothetical protein Q4E67_07085, partial [Planctomycetia bacterium]|nr:hypothetical protein [Planctomycetia bacterium]
RQNPGEKAVLEKSLGGWEWEKVAEVSYVVEENRLEIVIPRKCLGLEGRKIDLRFKWVDNSQNDGDILDFYQYGDAAPDGRFVYRYWER